MRGKEGHEKLGIWNYGEQFEELFKRDKAERGGKEGFSFQISQDPAKGKPRLDAHTQTDKEEGTAHNQCEALYEIASKQTSVTVRSSEISVSS
jgi:hypothetical protein